MKYFVSICFLVLAANVFSSPYGIGIDVSEYDTGIFIPIEFSEILRIEPFIRYYERDNSSVNHTFKSSDEYKYKEEVFGVGIFKKSNKSKVNHYSGVRLAYVKVGSRSDYQSNVIDNTPFRTGYRIEPLLGFEYSVNKQFKIAFEASLRYQETDANGDTVFQESERQDFFYEKEKIINTQTYFIARYFFK